jgi:hypothetical protein
MRLRKGLARARVHKDEAYYAKYNVYSLGRFDPLIVSGYVIVMAIISEAQKMRKARASRHLRIQKSNILTNLL